MTKTYKTGTKEARHRYRTDEKDVLVSGLVLDETPNILDISMINFPHFYASSFQPLIGPKSGLFLVYVDSMQEEVLDRRMDLLESALKHQGISATRLDAPNLALAIEDHVSNWNLIHYALSEPFHL
ncbi:MAG: hypothetical protein RTU63_14820 [Candidatus Thorarchaeota archaeon]